MILLSVQKADGVAWGICGPGSTGTSLVKGIKMICEHEDYLEPIHPRALGCEECLRLGTPWVHLRLCLTCGHVGCCDSSPGRHATKHFHRTTHPVVASFEPGERWAWCYIDQATLKVPEALTQYLR